MFRGILRLILVAIVEIRCQENEGLEDVPWQCTYNTDAGYYEDTDVMSCMYSATPFPDQLEGHTLFPDFSCHPGFNIRRMMIKFQRALGSGPEITGPNIPIDEDNVYCPPRFTVMIGDAHLDMMEEIVFDDDEDIDNYYYGNPMYFFKDSSLILEDMFGEELGAAVMRKVKEDCASVYQRVFYEERKRCEDPADEVYECVNKAIGCSGWTG